MFTVVWIDPVAKPPIVEHVEFDTIEEAKEKIESLIYGEEVAKEHVFLLEGRFVPFTFGVVLGELPKRKGRPKGARSKPKTPATNGAEASVTP